MSLVFFEDNAGGISEEVIGAAGETTLYLILAGLTGHRGGFATFESFFFTSD